MTANDLGSLCHLFACLCQELSLFGDLLSLIPQFISLSWLLTHYLFLNTVGTQVPCRLSENCEAFERQIVPA